MALRRLWMVVLAVGLALAAHTGATFKYPNNFMRFRWARAATDGNTLFLDGGELWYVDNSGNWISEALGCTIYVDLTVPWNNQTVELRYIKKPTDFPFSRSETIWFNPASGQIQFYGGWFYGQISDWMCDGTQQNVNRPPGPPDMWSLSYGSGTASWATSKQQPNIHVNPFRGPLSATSPDALYALGGWGETGDWNNEQSQPGLVIYDFKQDNWQNVSSLGIGYRGQGYAALGEAVYTDLFGDEGVIVYLGGYSQPQIFGIFAGGDILASMSLIYVYDIASKSFVSQQATGRIPDPRWEFCAAGVSETGSNTFDIYIYGGFAAGETYEQFSESLSTVYVLSLPSFVWTEIPFSGAGMRAMPACLIAGQRQLIVFGGDDPTGVIDAASPDPWPNALNVFDVSAWRWTTGYNPAAAPYKKNKALAKINAQTPYPKSWDSSKVKTIFDHNGAAIVTSTPKHKHSGGSSSNIGAIVGGVIGAVFGLLVVGLVMFAIWLKKRRERKLSQAQEDFYRKPELGADSKPRLSMHKATFDTSGRATPRAELGPHRAWEIGTRPSRQRFELVGDAGGKELRADAASPRSQRMFR